MLHIVAMVSPSFTRSSNSIRYWSFTPYGLDSPCLVAFQFFIIQRTIAQKSKHIGRINHGVNYTDVFAYDLRLITRVVMLRWATVMSRLISCISPVSASISRIRPRSCTKMKVCQKAHLLSTPSFLYDKAPTFTSWGFVIT